MTELSPVLPEDQNMHNLHERIPCRYRIQQHEESTMCSVIRVRTTPRNADFHGEKKCTRKVAFGKPSRFQYVAICNFLMRRVKHAVITPNTARPSYRGSNQGVQRQWRTAQLTWPASYGLSTWTEASKPFHSEMK